MVNVCGCGMVCMVVLWCVWCASDVQSDFLGFPPLPSCLVNHADISWFWQIWHIYEAGYLSAQQEQKSVYSISSIPSAQSCSFAVLRWDFQDILNLRYFAGGGRVAIYPESRNLFHYTALMTDPNSRGLTNSGNATICNGSTHWSITGHLRTHPPSLLPILTPISPIPHNYSQHSHTRRECAPQCPCVLCALYAPIFLICPKLADVMLAVAFLFSESSPLKHKSSRQQRERRTGGHSR